MGRDRTGFLRAQAIAVSVLVWLAGASAGPALADAGNTGPVCLVQYDPSDDRLSVQAEQAPLGRLLQHIATLADFTVEMDPAVERPVSVQFKDRSLAAGLGQILRGLDTVIVYDGDHQSEPKGSPTLASIKLLPKGKEECGSVCKGLTLSRPPARVAETGVSAPAVAIEPATVNVGQTRQGPLVHTPADRAVPGKSLLAERLRQIEERRARSRREHRVQGEQKLAQDRAQRQARETALQAKDPQRYQLRRQRQEEISERQ